MKRALLLLAACTRPPAPAPVGNVATTADEYLVWTVDDNDHGTTLWLDAMGNLRGHADGVLIAAAGTVWRLDTRTTTFPLRTCDQIDHDSPAPPAGDNGSGTQLLLTPPGGDPLTLNDPWEDEGYANLDWSATLEASLGPYVFVETQAITYGCGAHGGEEMNASGFDLGTRAEIPLMPGGDRAAAGEALEADEVQLVETIPAFADGAVGVRHLFIKDDCYACGNGLWSSYTSGAWIDDATLPYPLSKLPSVPRAVAAHATTERAGISWGPPATWRALFSPP